MRLSDVGAVLGRVVSVILVFFPTALLMGKKHLGEFTVLDLMIALTLGSVAGADLGDLSIPQGPTLVAILALGLVQILMSSALIRSRFINRALTPSPTLLIRNGVILKQNMAKCRYTLEDLFTHLREKEIFDLAEVEFAILEPNGVLSVLRKSQAQPVTPRDLNIPTAYKGLATAVILEGKPHVEGLKSLGLSHEWLKHELELAGYTSPDQVFVAILNTQGELFISPMKPPQDDRGTYHRQN